MALKISILILALLFGLFKGLVLAEDSKNCSSEATCTCYVKNYEATMFYTAICSHQTLWDFPHFNESVRWIDLAYNNISSLRNIKRLPRDLLSLNLSNNPILHMASGQFRKFKKLDELILQNLQEMDISNVPPDLLEGLGKLRTLDVKGWNMTSGEYPTEILVSVPTLRELRINGVQKPFRSGMRKLLNLRRLDLSGTIGNCNINILHSSYFENINNITSLDVSHCKLMEIHLNSISKFQFLKFLDISYNEEMTFAVFRNVTTDLSVTKIEVLKSDKIHCTFGVGTELMKSDIADLTKTPLRYLSLDSNRLELIESRVLLKLPLTTLQHISVVDNKFTMGAYLYDMIYLSNLVSINASYLSQPHRPISFKDCHEHANRKCHFSPVKYPENNYSRANEIVYPLQGSNFEGSPFATCIPLPKSLRNIYAAQSNLRYPIPSIPFCPNNVTELHLQGNIFNEWNGPVENTENLKVVDLSNNVCREVSTNFFKYAKGVEYLDLSNNLIGDSLKKDLSGEIFQELKQLQYFDLRFNRINVMSIHIFQSLINLKQLILRDNLIEDFNVDLENLSQLLLLDLSGNQLPTLSFEIRRSLSEIREHSKLKINITNNPLRCNCEDIDFWRWVSESDFIFASQEITCKVGKLKPSFNNMTKLADVVRKMDKLCASYVGIVAGISCAIGLLIALVLGGTVYRYRWKIRYLFYMTKNKYFGYAEIGNYHRDRNYTYDCFISYADEDRGFALHDVMNHLEKTTGLKLCFHQRDFVPGIDIAQNITNAIHQSQKTVCVLSPNYLSSYWCMYEFNMAKMESIYSRNGENILLLVFYRHVSPEDIPLNIMSIIEQKSYIEYPNDEQGDVVFWNKLKEVIDR